MKRKRRRQNGATNGASIVGPTYPSVVVPSALRDCQRAVVNAMATVLPLAAEVKMFGIWHPVTLCGCFYRHSNLTWIVRHAGRLHLGPHLMKDGPHLLEVCRDMIPGAERKWNREGFNHAVRIIAPGCAPFRLSRLPGRVLQFRSMQHTLITVRMFLRGQGREGDFLRRFRKERVEIVRLPTRRVLELTKGWSRFRNTAPRKGTCGGSKRRKCPCGAYRSLLRRETLLKMTKTDAVRAILKRVPSTVHEHLQSHFKAGTNPK